MWSVAQYSRAPWVETSFNAQATQRFIHRLLALFGHPPDAVEIYTSDM